MRYLNPPEGDYERDCVTYLRKSQGKTEPARQRKENQNKAKRLKWRIIAEFSDVDTTAFVHVLSEHRVVRKDYQAMLAFLQNDERPTPLGVLAWGSDRLHRDTEEVKPFIRICAKGKHPVETVVSGGFDLTTAAGRSRLIHDAAGAEREVDVMSERWGSEKNEAVAQGRWLGGPVPFGWRPVYSEDLERRVLVIVPEQADAIAWGSNGVLRGDVSLAGIAREWNRRGLRRHKGGLWDAEAVCRILLRSRNAALMEHKGKIVQTELENGKAEWPEIISEELWRAVARILLDPTRKTTPGPTPRWLGSGLYLCGNVMAGGEVCRAKMRVSGNSSGRFDKDGKRIHIPSYRCPESGPGHVSRHAANLDAFVEATLCARLRSPDVRRVLAHMEPPDLSGKRAELLLEKESLAEWKKAAKLPGASPSVIVLGEAATKERIKAIQAEIEAATVSPLLAELVAAGDINALWESKANDLGWRRAVLRLFVTVVVGKGALGLPVGWRKGDLNFDPKTISFEWKPLGGPGLQE